VLYQLSLPSQTSVTITYSSNHDNSLYILTDCADTTAQGCVVGADDNYQSPFSESLVLSNNANTPATYFVVLDNWRQNDCGDYTLDITP